MTMKELATLCHVSVSTVSKAFCDANDVSKETKELIFKIAKQQGCFGKFYKGKYHKKVIAIICPKLNGGNYSILVDILQKLIENDNGICIISTDNFNNKKQLELIEYYISYLKVDGLIVFGLNVMLKKGYETPIVSIFHSADSKVDTVATDIRTSVLQAINTLYSLGHTNVVFLGEKLYKSTHSHFKEAIKNFDDINVTTIESDKRFEEAGIDGINKLVSSNTKFTAIFCAHDNIAFGAMIRLKELGLSVPNDVSVISLNNNYTVGFSESNLTSIDTNPYDLCTNTYHLLNKKLKNKYFKSKERLIINTKIVIRESIGKVPEK